MRHESPDFIPHASKETVGVAVSLGDVDVGVAVLCRKRVSYDFE